MRLICPSCRAQYEIEAELIPLEGRDVQCSACDHVWFQPYPQPERPAVLAPAQRVAPPEPEVPDFLSQSQPFEVAFPTKPFQTPLGPEEDLPPDEEGKLDAQILKRHSLDENMMAILREEAEREAQARAEEEERLRKIRNLEFSQPAPQDDEPRLRIRPREAQDEAPMIEAEGPRNARAARRDLLPDIEQINSTLEAPRPNRRRPTPPEAAAKSSSGFMRGFVAMIVLAVIIWALYAQADTITALVPASEGIMAAYVNLIDSARLGLAEAMR